MNRWFHPEARAEFLESIRYYEKHRRGLGRHFLEAVTEALRDVQAHPDMYPVVTGTWRRCRVPKFPYGIIYRITGQSIQVVAVMHLHRQPGYWRHRPAGS